MGFRGGKLAMADIIAVGKLATAAQLYFWQRRGYALARMLRDGVEISDEPHVYARHEIIEGQSRRAGFALIGVQSSPRDMCSLLLTSRGGRGGCADGPARPRRAAHSVLHPGEAGPPPAVRGEPRLVRADVERVDVRRHRLLGPVAELEQKSSRNKQHYLSPTSNQDRFHVSTVTAEHASPRTAPTPMATTLSARVRAGAFGTRRRCTASG